MNSSFKWLFTGLAFLSIGAGNDAHAKRPPMAVAIAAEIPEEDQESSNMILVAAEWVKNTPGERQIDFKLAVKRGAFDAATFEGFGVFVELKQNGKSLVAKTHHMKKVQIQAQIDNKSARHVSIPGLPDTYVVFRARVKQLPLGAPNGGAVVAEFKPFANFLAVDQSSGRPLKRYMTWENKDENYELDGGNPGFDRSKDGSLPLNDTK